MPAGPRTDGPKLPSGACGYEAVPLPPGGQRYPPGGLRPQRRTRPGLNGQPPSPTRIDPYRLGRSRAGRFEVSMLDSSQCQRLGDRPRSVVRETRVAAADLTSATYRAIGVGGASA